MNFFTILSVASSATQLFASFQQAAAMRAYYQAQADVSRLQYQQKRIEAKEQANRVLRDANRTLGSTIAQAAAGGVLSSDGSVYLNQLTTLRNAAIDLNAADFNVNILSSISDLQYNNITQTANLQIPGALLNSLSGFGTDLVNINQSGLLSGKSKKDMDFVTSRGTFTTQDLENMDRGL
jgi:hypothetical protein|tara:strand:- start:6236 stop:6775 length:540 start_codon:yes stop_codon:yes gene_type:complete